MGFHLPIRPSKVLNPVSLGPPQLVPFLPVPKLSRTSRDGVLCFEYVEDGANSVPAAIGTDHTMIIPVQSEPIRVIAEHDGRVTRLTLNDGDVALAHAGALAGWQWLDPAKVILIHINPDAFRRFMETEMKVLINGSALEGRVVIHDPDLRSAAERMRTTLLVGDIGVDVVFDALARMFLVLLVRRYGKRSPVRQETGAQFGVGHYAKLVTYIEEHLEDKISPSLLAAELGMSVASFARKFKLTVGRTPMKFVSQMRIEAAAQLMAEGGVSLAGIAVSCGFSDQAHLSRSFKTAYGVSPTTYRAQIVSRT